MAKKSKGPKFNQTAPSFNPAPSEDKKYQLEDDSRTVRSYLDLKKDPGRHERAIGHMRSQVEGLNELSTRKEALPRKSRRLGSRNGRRGARR